MAYLNETSLTEYYNHMVPYDLIYRWMGYGWAHLFACREFAFTLSSGVHVRFQLFQEFDEFVECLKFVQPIKIDIGPVYIVSESDEFDNPISYDTEKELVFTINISDYDDARTCCTSADICKKCWKFLEIACKIVDTFLRNDLKFKHLLWTFSGRRGILCWLCDPLARQFDIEARGKIVDYLSVYKKEAPNRQSVIKQKLVIIRRALHIITPYFKDFIIIEQNILESELGLYNFLNIIDEEVRDEFELAMRQFSTSERRWHAFLGHLVIVTDRTDKYDNLIEEIYLHYCYPRMNDPESKTLNQLIRMPFSVHPDTGKFCVPFDPKAVEQFDPNNVPTIGLINNERALYDLLNDELPFALRTTEPFDKNWSSLREYLIIFEQFLNGFLPSAPTTTDYLHLLIAEAVYD